MLAEIILAAGCFWCVETDMEKVTGVTDVVSGYSGGDLMHPTYQNHHGHREVVKVTYDPAVVSDENLIKYFFRHVDWEDGEGAFCDRGFAYSPAVYYTTENQKKIAEAVAPEGSALPILAAKTFWEAEDYHQDYAKKNPIRYNYYRLSCGRDARVKELNSEHRDELYQSEISELGSFTKDVITNEGTERPYTHIYSDGHFYKNNPGIYVDILSGEPLYSTTDQYTSGTGWPSFHKPIEAGVLNYKKERWSNAIELKSISSYSHLGHIIWDNPYRDDGARHCINGVAIKHISVDKLEEMGYGEYLPLFEK